MKFTFTRLIVILVALALIGAIVLAFIPQPVDADVVEIARGPMEVTVNEDGRTRVRDKYIVSAPLAGQLQRIRMRAGDPVSAGSTVLATILPSDPAMLDARARAEAEARVRRAEAVLRQTGPALERAQAELDFAENELARVQTAHDRGAATRQELDGALLRHRAAVEAYNTARFGQDIARFEVELAQAALQRTLPDGVADEEQLDIHSPITGAVLRVIQESAAFVTAGTPLLELGDPMDLEVEVDVLSIDAVRIRPGTPVVFERWGGDEELRGTVRLVEPQAFTKVSALGVEEQRVNVIIDFDDPPETRPTLGDGYRVDARIIIWRGEDVLVVPTGALFRYEGKWAVYTVDEDDRAALQHIEIGRQSGLVAEVLDGLAEGQRVITHPSDAVREGVRVQAR